MQELAAYSTVAATLGLVVARPRVGRMRLDPAVAGFAGVLLLALLGLVHVDAAARAGADLAGPFAAIAAVMVMTAAAERTGTLALLAARLEAGAGTARTLFRRVFLLAVVTSTALNNDAAILLLTPLVVALVRRRAPGRPELVAPFAFAVFVAAGVAPLPVSNPMNMVVAGAAGIGLADYALRMLPVAAAGWLLSYALLALIFRRALAAPLAAPPADPPAATPTQRRTLALLAAVLVGYGVAGALAAPVWPVACAGALLALGPRPDPGRLARSVSWSTLAFLFAAMLLALALLDAGVVDRLRDHYAGAGPLGIGATSAAGSALLNNHPMAYINLLALDGRGHAAVLAALVGGDLGPRLLPIGSLAGLLWLDCLRRAGVDLPLRRFVAVGALVTLPVLALSLSLLALAG
ncbi:MAG TPA: SLC13 family permease [Kofleriaceae bacterium]|nr:SLC13 family permease [Kofleriaceae bacterium]